MLALGNSSNCHGQGLNGAQQAWVFPGDESSRGAAETIAELRLRASVLIDERAIVSEVPTAILILDLCNE